MKIEKDESSVIFTQIFGMVAGLVAVPVSVSSWFAKDPIDGMKLCIVALGLVAASVLTRTIFPLVKHDIDK